MAYQLKHIKLVLNCEGDSNKGQQNRQQVPPNNSTVIKQIHDINASIDLLRQQWFLKWLKSKDIKYYR